MRIADIKYNDTVNGEGICVSLWVQGCPHRCIGCHNPHTWDYDGGYEMDVEDVINTVLTSLARDNVKRNFSVLGGEPFAPNQIKDVLYIIKQIRKKFPDIKIFLWTGYKIEELSEVYLQDIDVIIDGRFELEKRDITLKWRGSPNQRILKKGENY